MKNLIKEIEVKVTPGQITYYNFTNRKVDYSLRISPLHNQWELWSKRQALGDHIWNTGTIRFFKNLKDIELKIKGLFGISQMIEEIN